MMKKHIIILVLILIVSCDKNERVPSPLGIYKVDTEQVYWLTIYPNEVYQLCSVHKCFKNTYVKSYSNHSIRLKNFYLSDIGLNLERLSAGFYDTEGILKALQQQRLNSKYPNDKPFAVGYCSGKIPCSVEGNMEDPLTYYQILNFDKYWKPK